MKQFIFNIASKFETSTSMIKGLIGLGFLTIMMFLTALI